MLLGRQVAGVMLSFLDVTATGDRVLPPYILETDWMRLGFGLAVLVVVVSVGLTASWVSSMRAADSTQLRITQ